MNLVFHICGLTRRQDERKIQSEQLVGLPWTYFELLIIFIFEW
jgi:hypothetical protein